MFPTRYLLASAVLLPSAWALGAPPTSDYKLIFADEFKGNSLDTMKWGYNYPWGHTHNHRAYVTESQVQVGSDRLNLQAIARRDPDAPATTTSGGVTYSLDYTSAAVNTSGLLNFTYGYVEASIKMSNVQGTWPAFWMLQSGWPPEIDIMEFPRGASNSATQYWANWHYTNSSNQHASEGWQRNAPNLTTGYNTFGMEWTATSMKFYLNGALMNSVQNTASIAQAANMYLILNQAVGGWPGDPPSNSAFPSNYEVDYVRVYQKPGTTNTISAWQAAGSGSWDSAGNWTNVTPKFADQVATFGTLANSSSSVTWSGSRTVGGISFSGTTAYTLAAGPSAGLQLANSAGPYIEATAASPAAQTINARLELYNNTGVRNDMTNGAPINLNGPIVGVGTLSVDGAGMVVLSGSNSSYTGGTTLDAVGQGPAVLRVAADNALGTGPVVIGPAGNATTARLELYNNHTIPNAIDLRGRNNSSVAIQSIRGDNKLTGTVTLGVGGSTYLIQSDSPATLALNAPTAITSAATGPRTVTLQGAGNGTVAGAIANGSATLSLTKSGAGTWTLSGANTYTGLTTVLAGKLIAGPPSFATILTNGANVAGGQLVFSYSAGNSPMTSILSKLSAGTFYSSASDLTHSLAYADNGSAISLFLATTGDLNLDGTLNADDYTLLDRGFARHLANWQNGDLNYDNVINDQDYFLIDRTYASQQASFSPNFLAARTSQFGSEYITALLASLPEPSAFLASTSVCLLVAGSRRRGNL